MLVLEDLPAATRLALVAKLSDTLAQFVVARNWLSADRAGRIADEAREEARTFCEELVAEDVIASVSHDLIAA